MNYQALRLAGRCADGAERGQGVRYHAVPMDAYRALCGATYGRMSAGWSHDPGAEVTCPRCLKKLARASSEGHTNI